MASTGATNPGTATTTTGTADRVWNNPTNMLASDNSYSDALTLTAGRTTEVAKLTNFGFAIPSTATIDGIEVTIERSVSTAGAAKDLTVKLIKGGTIQTTNKADTATNWPTTDGIATYGGASDLWGGTWLYSDINASTFGVSFSAQGSTGTGDARVDNVKINIYYTVAAGGFQSCWTTQSNNLIAGGIS